MPSNRKILISGAGISGLTLAYWLQEWGFAPTIIEKRPDLDDPGYMIDFYGSGFDIAERMGLLDRLETQSSQYPVLKLLFVDNRGKTRASFDLNRFKKLLHNRYLPLLRGDLETAIYETIEKTIPVQFQASIMGLNIESDGVSVEFSDGRKEKYDLVIGADGIHSNVRRLLWGDERQFSLFLGFYVVCSVIDNFFGKLDSFYGHFEPKTQTIVYPIGKNRLAVFFAFKSEKLNVKSRAQQIEVLADVFGDLGWIVPRLVDATKQAENFFFDGAAQIQLEIWHKERVALVGDACQCLTLLAGQGASMGMAGAYLLAEELHKTDGDYKIAFSAYQERLKPEIKRRQKDARGLAGSFVPFNDFQISLSYFFLNAAFLPGFSSLFKKQIGARSIIK